MTVEEILKQSGLNDDQIKALDQKIISSFTTVLTTASAAETAAAKAREETQTAQRAQEQLYRDQIAPALDNWANEKATLEAEREFYRKQNESARSAGFLPKEAPGYQATSGSASGETPRDGQGRFVPGGNPVPGSPAYLTFDQGLRALSNAHWADAEYFRLMREPIPDDLETLLQEATAKRMDFRVYVEEKYGFKEKRKQIAEAKQKEHDDKIAKETEERVNKQWAEKVGNNPNLRVAQESQFATITKGIQSGSRKDPLTMTEAERHANTRSNIMTEISENESQRVH